uniref:Uncharacterized protein n=1 Tax=Coccidioides posadasii RMSCC 3488 TaxID=454284 RepID=A0A0J6F5J1_COCPO|nr:hypothetical protein CPAG_00566 [Coccidioides posadasii RMSCC 3488]
MAPPLVSVRVSLVTVQGPENVIALRWKLAHRRKRLHDIAVDGVNQCARPFDRTSRCMALCCGYLCMYKSTRCTADQSNFQGNCVVWNNQWTSAEGLRNLPSPSQSQGRGAFSFWLLRENYGLNQ